MPQLATGETIAGYQIDCFVGRGGMGEVYRATQLTLDRPVAVKLIAPELSQDTSFHDRFRREARIAASLRHPNVLPVYESGEADGQLFLSMAFVEGRDLAALLKDEGALDPHRAATIVSKVGSALDAAHAKGLVHRDVKPANVLLEERDGEQHVYLTDFGLSKVSTASNPGPTQTGQLVGTVDYISPEQISTGHVDARSDVYSLGCLLYECLTGEPPFPRPNEVAKIWAHVNERPTLVSTLRPGLPAAFDGVLAKALEKDPADRYASAGDLGLAALAAAEGRTLPSSDRSVPRREAAIGSRLSPRRADTPTAVDGAGCSSCGEENPERARFCLACGAPLADAAEPDREERKVVTVLFVDLVGFTAASEAADPEDVRATLRPYHARLKQEIEGFGGTVEKFIGDAVMAVFGAPVAHEDDAERAVRAGLRVLEAVADLREQGVEIAVRAAVNTGEALVSLGARPERGEGMVTGDVVNTTSRLQGAAPVSALVAGELTVQATRGVIEYEPLQPVTVKGKAEPVGLWRAVQARGRFGVDAERDHSTPIVGREVEVALLTQAYRRALREPGIQLVTITGEPGIGKSRLVAELFELVEEEPELIWWRQGRSLPYGEGVTFWALGEIVKAHAGILESDPVEQASAKLAATLDGLFPDEGERRWVLGRLQPLIGASAPANVEREEAFAAWTQFLEAVAQEGPLVLVLEDLHWADDALLAFVEHLVDWATGLPIVVVCTARPELYERATAWGGGKRNSTTIALSPLTGEETGALVASLLERHALPAELVEAVLERSGGNPLYAEEFVRMLQERGLLRERGRTLELAGDLELPHGVAALVAARLDTLSPERKALLQDAAVLGKVFWAGALAAMGDRDAHGVMGDLQELARKELVRRSRSSSVEGESEWSFWHLVLRDVAYGQIPRAGRADRHLQAARWIEQMAGNRVTDHAELIAHHYAEALELARAAGMQSLAEELEAPAARFLTLAGDRALGLDYAKADRFFERALALTRDDALTRAGLLLKVATTTEGAGRLEDAEQIALEAVAVATAGGDDATAAQALLHLGRTAAHAGLVGRSEEYVDRAVALLEPRGASRELADSYCRRSVNIGFAGDLEGALVWARRGLDVATEAGDSYAVAQARGIVGQCRFWGGDLDGRDDLEAAIAESERQGVTYDALIARTNLADCTWLVHGPAEGIQALGAVIETGGRRGLAHEAMWARAETLRMRYELGDWDELLEEARELAAWAVEREIAPIEVITLTQTAAVEVARGTPTGYERARQALERAGTVEEDQLVLPTLLVAARAEADAGKPTAALSLLTAAAARSAYWRMHYLAEAVRLAVELDDRALAEQLLDGAEPRLPRHRIALTTARAALAEADGDLSAAAAAYADARTRWQEYGHLPEAATAALAEGRVLTELGRPDDARSPLHQAAEILHRLRAGALLDSANRKSA